MQSILRDSFKALYVTSLVVAGIAVFLPRQAQSQEHYISNADREPGGDSARTGTQGVNGNPFCASPVVTINGAPTTIRNWSCYNGPDPRVSTIGRQPPQFSGASNPCQPGGLGGYNYLDNPEGAQLPAGCVRPASRSVYGKADPSYDPRPMTGRRAAPIPPQYPYSGTGDEGSFGRIDPWSQPRPMGNYRRPPMPVGQLATGEVDPYYDPRPVSTYRRPTMPIGQSDGPQNYRRPHVPIGQLSR